MDRDDGRIAKVLEELADLGRRIGERAGELARLTKERQRAPTLRSDDGVAGVHPAAAEPAPEAAAWGPTAKAPIGERGRRLARARAPPGYHLKAVGGIGGRGGTRRWGVAGLGGDLGEVVALADVRASLESEGAAVIASTPEQFAATLGREMATWSQIVKASGAKPE